MKKENPWSLQARRFAGASLLLALALVLGRGMRRAPVDEQPFEEEPDPNPAAPGAAPAAAKLAQGAPAAQPVLARPLDADEVPAPGAPRRASAGSADPSSAAFPRTGLSAAVSPSFGSGGSAPTATSGPALVSAPADARSGAPQGAAPRRTAAPAKGANGSRPPAQDDGGLSMDGRLGTATAGVLAAARRQKADAEARPSPLSPAGIGSLLMRGIAADNKIDSDLRGAIDEMQRSGTATPEAMEKAAAGIIAANGGGPVEPEDVQQALARASGPPSPPASPQALAAAAQDVFSGPPLTPAQQAEIVQNVENPPAPPGPAPKNALQAFTQNRDVFDKALKDSGVKPEDILGICMVESACGRGDMGKLDAGQTLQFLIEKYAGQPRGKQAAADAKALIRLKAQGQLGGSTPPVNWAGAMGVPQFLFSSWEAYGRGVGPNRDPRSLPDSILSIANYLHVHGYSQDVGRSILAYNHSTEYENKVLSVAASIAPIIHAARAPGAPAAPAAPAK